MHHEIHILLETVVVAIALGIAAQVLAQRFKLPAILPLLLFGMAAGPQMLGFFDPSSLGHGLEVFVHLGVAVILFEGGLSLDPRQMRRIGGPLRNLLTLGTLVTAFAGAWLTHWLLEVSWSTAALFGAIVTVTGPTVIAPLLRHMIVPRSLRTLLISEGLIIDPIGAVLAYFVLQWIERAGLEPRVILVELLTLCLWGGVLGFTAGALATFVVRYRHMADEIRNLVILAALLLAFLLAESQAPQSGILAAVVMGLTVTLADIPDIVPLKEFKGQLTVLMISMLFILLSGQLDLQTMYNLGWPGLTVVAGLIFVVRPLAVMVSMPLAGTFGWREKLVLSLTAPRGIVAAAVASVAAIQLRSHGDDTDAAILEGLVYLVILTTCAWATLMAPILPRLLGYLDDPSRRRAILVGAHPLSIALGKLFRASDWTAVIIDSSVRKLQPLRDQGFVTVCGDARDLATYEEAGTERDSYVIALTTNDELNLLIAELARGELGVEHPTVALQQPSSELGRVRRAWVDILGGGALDLPRWMRRLDDGKAVVEQIEIDRDPDRIRTLRSFFREQGDKIFVLCGWNGDRPSFRVDLETLGESTRRLTLLVQQESRERLAELVRRPLKPVEEPEPVQGSDEEEE